MKCLTRRSEGFGLLLLVAMVSLLSSSYSAFGYENDKAISKLVEADESIFEAFEMLLETEEAGANVSTLTAQLNQARTLLTEAEILSRSGNADEAGEMAHYAVIIANDVQAQALDLKNLASADRQDFLLFSAMYSLVGISVFLIVLFFVWKWFRQVYARKLLRMKPEVA